MRADLPGVERTQQRLHSGIDTGKFVWIDPSAGDAGLVAHHADSHALAPELVEGTPGARHWLDSPRVSEIGHIFDQGSIPIEEHGPQLAGRSMVFLANF